MSVTPHSSVINSKALWPAIAEALGLQESLRQRVTRVEIVLALNRPVDITVTLGVLGGSELIDIDWPQFDPSQITIKGGA